MFDVPVFWPILLLYWLLLFTVTMKRQIKHMIKYRYLPFTTGKKVSYIQHLLTNFSSRLTSLLGQAGTLLICKKCAAISCMTGSSVWQADDMQETDVD